MDFFGLLRAAAEEASVSEHEGHAVLAHSKIFYS